MSGCPFHNVLDPDFYAQGDHHLKLQEINDAAANAVVKVDDPITGIPYWLVLSRELADEVCKAPQLYSSERRTCYPMEMEDDSIAIQAQMLVNMDPPKHQKYRRIARNAFTPTAVESYRPQFEAYAKEIVDKVASRGECEFVSEVAAELPLMAILDLCGVPIEDRHDVFRWTNEMFFQQDEDMSGEDPQARAQEAQTNLFMYAEKLVQQHREKPLSNIVGALLDSEVEDEHLTEMEFQLFFLMLIAAGNESTRSVTAHGWRLLMENPDQLQLLVDNPDLIPDAVEEMLRVNPAFIGMRRTVTEDTVLGGQALQAGDKLILNWHLINIDAEVFDDPLRFDITRQQRMPSLYRDHRAFGVGQHFCLGSHLARLELNIILNELVPRLRNPTFAAPVSYVRDYFVNGIKEMRICFDPETTADTQKIA